MYGVSKARHSAVAHVWPHTAKRCADDSDGGSLQLLQLGVDGCERWQREFHTQHASNRLIVELHQRQARDALSPYCIAQEAEVLKVLDLLKPFDNLLRAPRQRIVGAGRREY